MRQISLIVGYGVIPALAFGTNLVLRWGKGMAQSAGGDLVLLLLVFDAGVLIAHKEFGALVADPVLAKNLIGIYVFLLFAGFLGWIFAVTVAEKAITRSFNQKEAQYESRRWFLGWLLSWVVIVGLLIGHVLSFTYRMTQ